jgi:hypothetical protein
MSIEGNHLIVPDEDQRDSHCVEDLGAPVVVAGEHDKALALVLEATKVQNRCGHGLLLMVPGVTPPGQ